MSTLIEFDGVCKYYQMGDTLVKAADHVSFKINKGEFVAIVGQSGSGKSTCMNIIGCLDVPTEGTYLLDGRDVGKMSRRELASIRNEKLGFIFQQYNLLPKLTLLENVEVPLVYAGIPAAQRHATAKAALERVGLGNKLKNLPNQLSGGQQQRVSIARALARGPAVILADEPTTALDVTVQAQVLDLLKDLQKEMNTSILLITHNLGVVWEMCDKVMVMYAGNTVESADTKTLYSNPLHPYTWGLLDSIPRLSDKAKEDLRTIPGTPPDLRLTGQCCNFYNRCPYMTEECRKSVPPLVEVEPGHFVACHRQNGEKKLVRGEGVTNHE